LREQKGIDNSVKIRIVLHLDEVGRLDLKGLSALRQVLADFLTKTKGWILWLFSSCLLSLYPHSHHLGEYNKIESNIVLIPILTGTGGKALLTKLQISEPNSARSSYWFCDFAPRLLTLEAAKNL